jgi:hypothetical protein
MKVAKIFYGLRQKAARKFRWLGKVRAAWCSAADRLHAKEWRVFAHTGHKPGVVCWARAAERELTPAEIEGVGGHEFGHLVGEKTKAPAHRRHMNASGRTPQSVQDEADAIAAQLFGCRIRYNKRRLQEFGSSRKNPSPDWVSVKMVTLQEYWDSAQHHPDWRIGPAAQFPISEWILPGPVTLRLGDREYRASGVGRDASTGLFRLKFSVRDGTYLKLILPPETKVRLVSGYEYPLPDGVVPKEVADKYGPRTKNNPLAGAKANPLTRAEVLELLGEAERHLDGAYHYWIEQQNVADAQMELGKFGGVMQVVGGKLSPQTGPHWARYGELNKKARDLWRRLLRAKEEGYGGAGSRIVEPFYGPPPPPEDPSDWWKKNPPKSKFTLTKETHDLRYGILYDGIDTWDTHEGGRPWIVETETYADALRALKNARRQERQGIPFEEINPWDDGIPDPREGHVSRRNPRGWFHAKQKGSRELCLYSHPGRETLAARMKKRPAKRRAVKLVTPPVPRPVVVRPAIRRPLPPPPSVVAAPRPPMDAVIKASKHRDAALAAIAKALEVGKRKHLRPGSGPGEAREIDPFLKADPEAQAVDAEYKRAVKALRKAAEAAPEKVTLQAIRSMEEEVLQATQRFREELRTIDPRERASARRAALAARKAEISRGVPPKKATTVPTWAAEVASERSVRRAAVAKELAGLGLFEDIADLIVGGDHYLDYDDQRKLLRVLSHLVTPDTRKKHEGLVSAIADAIDGQIKTLPEFMPKPGDKTWERKGVLDRFDRWGVLHATAKGGVKWPAIAPEPIQRVRTPAPAPAPAPSVVLQEVAPMVAASEAARRVEAIVADPGKHASGPQAAYGTPPKEGPLDALNREAYELMGFHYVGGRGWEPAIGWKDYLRGKSAKLAAAGQARLAELAGQYRAIAARPERSQGIYEAKGMLRTIDQVLQRQGKTAMANPERAGKIVGWHTAQGTQYCTRCVPRKPRESYPIRKGDPDWSYGSVPICKKCRQELDTT